MSMTPEEKDIYQRAMTMKAAGKDVQQMTKELKISKSKWYYIRAKKSRTDGTAKQKTKTKPPQHVQMAIEGPARRQSAVMMPVTKDGPMTLVMGTPEQLSRFVREAMG